MAVKSLLLKDKFLLSCALAPKSVPKSNTEKAATGGFKISRPHSCSFGVTSNRKGAEGVRHSWRRASLYRADALDVIRGRGGRRSGPAGCNVGKEKGRGGGLSLSGWSSQGPRPRANVGGGNPRGQFVSTDPRSTVPLLGFNSVSSEEEMVSSGG
jgi:hypothetical protein